jgi:hypothetical protein
MSLNTKESLQILDISDREFIWTKIANINRWNKKQKKVQKITTKWVRIPQKQWILLYIMKVDILQNILNICFLFSIFLKSLYISIN